MMLPTPEQEAAIRMGSLEETIIKLDAMLEIVENLLRMYALHVSGVSSAGSYNYLEDFHRKARGAPDWSDAEWKHIRRIVGETK